MGQRRKAHVMVDKKVFLQLIEMEMEVSVSGTYRMSSELLSGQWSFLIARSVQAQSEHLLG